jgi:hypothetical protein
MISIAIAIVASLVILVAALFISLAGFYIPLLLIRNDVDKNLSYILEYGIYILFFSATILASKTIMFHIVIFRIEIGIPFQLCIIGFFFLIGVGIFILLIFVYTFLVLSNFIETRKFSFSPFGND